MKFFKKIALCSFLACASIGLWEGGKLIYKFYFPWTGGNRPSVTLGNSTPYLLKATFFNNTEFYEFVVEPCRTCKTRYLYKEETCTADTSYKIFSLNPTRYKMRIIFDKGNNKFSNPATTELDLTRSDYADCIGLTDK